VTDGAYAKLPFLMPGLALGVTTLSLLRRKAVLWSLPLVVAASRRGCGLSFRIPVITMTLGSRATLNQSLARVYSKS
jgi:hypothetical protein